MELEFKQETIADYDILTEMTLCQEETLESIVPDACPDILRIVDVCGQAMLTGKQAHEGLASVSGVVRAVILYQPEGGGSLRKMDVSLPFNCQAESAGLTEMDAVHAGTRLRFAEARVLNPRKVLLRVDLAVDITTYRYREQKIVCGAETAQMHNLCQLQCECEHYYVSYVQEKNFTFQEQIRLQNAQAEQPVLLTSRAQALCTESKLIGSKLIFKGVADLALMMQESGGTLSVEKDSLPFSQIVEVPGAYEDCDCAVRLEVTDFQCRSSEHDSHIMEVTLELLAMVRVQMKRPVTYLRDLYSTSHTMETEIGTHSLNRFRENMARTQSVRELIETPEMVRCVVDSRITLGKMDRRADESDLLLTTDAWVTVLYLDENESLRCVRKMIDVGCRLGMAQEMLYSCQCHVPGEVYATPAAGGIEVRFSVDFHCCSAQVLKIEAINAARLGEPRAASRENVPSVILRLALPGEGLWELAKTYGTTTQLILQANNMESESALDGRMLLIPGCR